MDKWNESTLSSTFEDQVRIVADSVERNVSIKKTPLTNKSKKYRYDENSEIHAKKTTQVEGIGETIYRATPKNITSKQKQSPTVAKVSLNKSLKDEMKIQGLAGDCALIPPPVDISDLPAIENENQARASMLMSWYMAGYHTGYFEAMRKLKK